MRLLGGVRLKQEEAKVINLEEKKLNFGPNNGLLILRDSSPDTMQVDN